MTPHENKKGAMYMFYKSKLLVLSLLLFSVGLVGCSSSQETSGTNKNFTVGVVTGTTFEEAARKLTKVTDVKLYKDDNQTLLELANGRLDGVITDRMVGLLAIKGKNLSNLKLAGDLIYKETIAVAFRQDDDSLRQHVNKALADIISDGTYDQISNKWFDTNLLNGVEYEKTSKNDQQSADKSLKKIQDAGKIRFAMSGGYPPFNYYNDKNELVGFDVDIARAIAKKLGVEFEPVTTDWNGIIEGLRAGRYDGILGSMAVTEERLKVVDFSDPYYYSGAQLMVSKDSGINGPEDLK
jgi:ABC-type amino acid transport substrate-binding protein